MFEEFGYELRPLPVYSVITDVQLYHVFINGQRISNSQSSLVTQTVPGEVQLAYGVVPLKHNETWYQPVLDVVARNDGGPIN